MNIAKIAVSANTTDSIYDKGISVKNYVLFSRSRMNKMLLRAQETDTLTGALNTAGIIRLGNMIAEKKLLQRFTVVFFKPEMMQRR